MAEAVEKAIKIDKRVDSGTIMSILNGALGARMKLWLKSCYHCGLCADSCFFYLAHGKDPKYMPSYKVIKTLGEISKRKGKVSRQFLEEAADIVFGNCTGCRRCSMYCPFGIDIGVMLGTVRAICAAYDLSPEALLIATKNYEEFDNQMAVSEGEWIDTCQWMEGETAEELPGLTIPMDKKGAKILYTINAREAKFYPQDIAQAAMIFHVAGEDWTMSAKGWDVTNLAMFAGKMKTAAEHVKSTYDAAMELEVKQIVITE
jgi:Fe-S oxidoreductase